MTKELEKSLYGLTKTDVRLLAYEIPEKVDNKHPFNKESKMTGKDWLSGFFTHHPDLSVRQPTSQSLERLLPQKVCSRWVRWQVGMWFSSHRYLWYECCRSLHATYVHLPSATCGRHPYHWCTYNTADNWMMTNPGKRISIYDMVGIFGKAFLQSATPDKAVCGFASCGLWPYDANIFTDDDLVTYVTDKLRHNLWRVCLLSRIHLLQRPHQLRRNNLLWRTHLLLTTQQLMVHILNQTSTFLCACWNMCLVVIQ